MSTERCRGRENRGNPILMSPRNRALTPIFLLVPFLAAWAGGASAALLPGDLQVHGFASQGWVLTSGGNNVAGSSSDANGSGRYQEFGVNGSWRPFGDLLVAGQVASIRSGNAVDQYLDLEYAVVDYSPVQGELGRAGVRAGKLKLPIGFYNESRDAVFTRPGILMPQGVYLDTSGGREFGYFSQYGGGLYADLNAGNHAVYFEGIGLVKQPLGDRADIAILRTTATGRFWLDEGALVRLMDDYNGGRMRAAVSLAKVKVAYESAGVTACTFPGSFLAGDIFCRDGTLDFKQAVASLEYNSPVFSLTGEYVWRVFHLTELAVANPFGLTTNVALRPSGAYLQGTIRESQQLSTYLRYDEEIRDANDRWGTRQEQQSAAVSAASGGAIPAQPAYYYYARDWTGGTRYDIDKNLSVWAEFHYVEGDAWLNPLDNEPTFGAGKSDKYWTLFTAMLSYRF
jgi:hypothetical protein